MYVSCVRVTHDASPGHVVRCVSLLRKLFESKGVCALPGCMMHVCAVIRVAARAGMAAACWFVVVQTTMNQYGLLVRPEHAGGTEPELSREAEGWDRTRHRVNEPTRRTDRVPTSPNQPHPRQPQRISRKVGFSLLQVMPWYSR